MLTIQIVVNDNSHNTLYQCRATEGEEFYGGSITLTHASRASWITASVG